GYTPTHIWYWATDGNDSTCVADDVTKPCLTWNTVYQTKAASGDAVVVRGGTYTLEAIYWLKATNPLIVMGYPGEKPIIATTPSWSGCGGFGGNAINHIFDGLVVVGNDSGQGFSPSATSLITGYAVRNCEISHFYRGIWGIGYLVDMLIENNVIHDNPGEHNVYLGQNLQSVGHATNVVVRNNIMYKASWDNYHFNGIC